MRRNEYEYDNKETKWSDLMNREGPVKYQDHGYYEDRAFVDHIVSTCIKKGVIRGIRL